MTPSELYAKAESAAKEAAIAHEKMLPPPNERGLDCGIAWVVVRPARGAFVNWCRENEKGKLGWAGGWCFHCPGTEDVPTQSMSTYEAAADAFQSVLNENGINAIADSRLD